MKVCMIVHSYYPADSRVRRECEALRDRGDAVDVICLRDDHEPSYEDVHGIHTYRLPIQHRKGGMLPYLFEYGSFFLLASLKLAVTFCRRRYQIIQIHNMPDFLVFSSLFPKLLGAKVILDMHDATPELFQSIYAKGANEAPIKLLRWIEAASLRYADFVITVHEPIKRLFTSRSRIHEKIAVVMNSPDPRYFRARKYRMNAWHTNGRLRIIYHGNITGRYNLDTIVYGIEILWHEIPGICLDIYGDGEKRRIESIRQLVRDRGLEQWIRFHSWIPIDEVPAAVEQADIGVVPATSEIYMNQVAIPVRMLEYAAMGIPIIAADVGAVKSFLGENAAAYYTPDDPYAFSDRVLDLRDHPEKPQEMIQAASSVLQRYSWLAMRQRYYDILDDVVACQNRRKVRRT